MALNFFAIVSNGSYTGITTQQTKAFLGASYGLLSTINQILYIVYKGLGRCGYGLKTN